jgi:esterase/lipase superfamily enzyme
MNREYHCWFSDALHRDMEMLVFGHGGARMLVFPTSLGKFYEWEDRGMMRALSEHLERGWLQLYCVDSVDAESWYAKWAHPSGRVIRHIQYENYILQEVLPFSMAKNPSPYLIAAGASFGAYHAVNFSLRHPDLVNRVLGFNGTYDISSFTDGYHDSNIYFNNPVEYLQHERDPQRLAQLRSLDIILTTGRDDPGRANTEYLSRTLWAKHIWHALRIWDGWAHDWPWWHKMVQLYVGGAD